MNEIAIERLGEKNPEEIAQVSATALDVPLAGDAVLMLARPSAPALVLGAFQRATATGGLTTVRRGSGGPSAHVGPGSLWVALALAHPSALVACEPSRIVNRYVRPLLRALTKSGALAHYFGREWISVGHRPVALVTFAHDATSRRTLFEAIVGVSHPFALAARASFRGKEPGTLAEITGRDFDLAKIEDAIVEAYAHGHAHAHAHGHAHAHAHAHATDPPWLATTSEPIGEVGAGPDAAGLFRVGGDLLVSRDALAALEARALRTEVTGIATLVNETLGAPGVAIDGVRDLASIANVVARALSFARDP